MAVVYIYVALASYNTGYLTLPMDSVECLVDEAGHVAVVDERGRLVHGQGRKDGEENGGKGSVRKKGKKGGKRSRQGSLSVPQGMGLDKEVDWRTLWMEGTDAVMDIPIGGVCEILYGVHDDMDYDIAGQAHER